MSNREPYARELAIEAAARGWLSPVDLWEVAGMWFAGQSAARLLEQRLSAEQLAELERSSDRIDTLEDLAASPLPPPPDIPALSSTGRFGPISSRDPAKMPGGLSGDRYREDKLIGKGGAGQVISAVDREIGRTVALKTLRQSEDPEHVRRFLIEARVTAQLEHPGIIPIHDLGVLGDGTPFYTMRMVEKRSLSTVLASDALRADWPLVRLLGVLVQLARALAYAHSRGVLHGDVKPDNILLGDFGEVYLADWGLTRVQPHSPLREAVTTIEPPPHSLLSLLPRDSGTAPTRAGGTPGYVAPEVAFSDGKAIDHRADLFSLGVVLYEVLTGWQPFFARNAEQTILATLTRQPEPPRELEPSCPLLLEDLCLELLAKDPDARPSSADDVARRIEEYLEGAKEKDRRREEAARLCASAEDPARRWRELDAEYWRLSEEAQRLLRDIESWAPVEKKRPAWQREDRAEEAQRDAARALASAVDLFTKALGYDPNCEEAHDGLLSLYAERARTAELERREATKIYYEEMALDHDVNGSFAAQLGANGSLSLTTDPIGATASLYRYVEHDRVLVAGGPRALGNAPLSVELPPASYLLILSLAGYRDVRYPVLIRRGEQQEARIKLYRDDELGEGYVYVPAGVTILGGDPLAYHARPRQRSGVADFAIGKFPVSVREYCAFLDALPDGEAERRAPHDLRGSEGMAVERGSQGWEPKAFMIEGEARKLFPLHEGSLWKLPIHLIDWFDALAYCRWQSVREGVELRLATEVEWEKAARGADGRVFPWGDRFDATFCLIRGSRPFMQQPEPMGTFPKDESPYGVRDMAGGMREWVADLLDERTAEECAAEPEPDPETERGSSSLRGVRSGGWNTGPEWSRAASRGPLHALTRGTALTFRLAKTLRRAD